jgi:two-component system, OmpR family, response regulator
MKFDKPLNRIMYVDDDPDLRQIVAMGLKVGGGYTVKVCSSGNQAIAELPGFQPDLLIMDVVMPDMTGPKTVEVMKETPGFPEVPLVFLTSKVNSNELKQYRALGAIGVIRKPMNPMHITTQVMDIWNKHSLDE